MCVLYPTAYFCYKYKSPVVTYNMPIVYFCFLVCVECIFLGKKLSWFYYLCIMRFYLASVLNSKIVIYSVERVTGAHMCAWRPSSGQPHKETLRVRGLSPVD